jgi:hypothetical protein
MQNERGFQEPDEFNRFDLSRWEDIDDDSDSWIDDVDADELSDCEAEWFGDIDHDNLPDAEYADADDRSDDRSDEPDDEPDDDWDEHDSEAEQEFYRHWNTDRDDR